MYNPRKKNMYVQINIWSGSEQTIDYICIYNGSLGHNWINEQKPAHSWKSIINWKKCKLHFSKSAGT